jgi:ATP adenylyltransferase/5',5'''-P-1,P-4-tetraphosphate phosphorylase II
MGAAVFRCIFGSQKKDDEKKIIDKANIDAFLDACEKIIIDKPNDDYECWNDRVVAHTFVRLITKNNPHNNTPLTLDEFNADYATLLGYIEWKRKNKFQRKRFAFYNFTPDNMTSFINLIRFDTDNMQELKQKWNVFYNII